ERGRRRGGDRARRRVNEELERERAAQDGVLPWSVVSPSVTPVAPRTGRRVDASLDLGTGGQNERLLVGAAEDEQAVAACARRELTRNHAVTRRCPAGSEGADGDRVTV